jgi:hypothetical protein
MRNKITSNVILSLIFCQFFNLSSAQTSDSQTIRTILLRDSLFWVAYNTCDTVNIGDFYTDDVEFYSDKDGFSKEKDNIVSNFKRNLCSDNFRLRREALDSTIKVFLLKNQDTVYGAIINGEHYFYINEKGKNERLDGWAKFTHTWVLQNGTWKMKRILSYDHKPAPYINKRKAIKISSAILDKYVGQYKGPETSVLISKGNENLVQIVNGKKFIIYPETSTLFFLKEVDLTFEFTEDRSTGQKMIVRQNGEIVEEVTLLK